MLEYPIEGPYRLLCLGLEFSLVVLSARFSGQFFVKYFRSRGTLMGSNVFLLWALFYASFGGMIAFYLKSDYYSTTDRIFYLNLAYIYMNIGLIAFTWTIENIETFQFPGKWKHIFTGIFLFNLAGLTYFAIVDPTFSPIFSIFTMFPAGLLGLRYSYILYKQLKHTRRFESLMCSLSVLSLYFGYLFTTDRAIELFGSVSRVVGDVVMLISMALNAFFFARMPSIDEFEWKKLLDKIFVVNDAGMTLYFKDLKTGAERQSEEDRCAFEAFDCQLIMGAFTSVKDFFTNAFDLHSPLKTITQGDRVFLVEHRQNLMFVLICRQALESHRKLLTEFAAEFTRMFQENMGEKIVDLDRYHTADALIEQIFDVI